MAGRKLAMSSIEIKSSSGDYSIHFEHSAKSFSEEIEFLIVDSQIRPDQRPAAKRSYVIDAIEANKTLESVTSIIQAMAAAGLTRNSELHAVGGGIVQDLATLASSLYMRGIRWAYWPTTLTGMLDSCVGGKSSINLGAHKNLIGNFHPPKNIYLDTNFLETLPPEHLLSGLAEGVKICYARGDVSFEEFLDLAPGAKLQTGDAARKLARLCLDAKKWFVEVDEYDKKERQLLNFGHSFGHAFESATDYKVPHGISVALGILAAVKYSKNKESQNTKQLVEYCLSILTLWRTSNPGTVLVDWSAFSVGLAGDKKNSQTELRLVLPTETGALALLSFAFSDGALDLATDAMRSVADEVLN
jgi:3-dehydroquinate synthase